MKTITKISLQKAQGRYNLFLDEVFFCGISEETLIKLNLRKGMEIEEEELESLIAEERRNQCFNYGMWLLGKQNYFEKVIATKLKQKEYTEEEIAFALEKLKAYRYLDDTKLTEAFVSDKKRFAKKGSHFIADALRMKGVNKDLIKATLEENYSEEEEMENCLEIAQKKLKSYQRKALEFYALKGKMYAFLSQRGFKSSVIKKVMDQLFTSNEENQDYL